MLHSNELTAQHCRTVGMMVCHSLVHLFLGSNWTRKRKHCPACIRLTVLLHAVCNEHCSITELRTWIQTLAVVFMDVCVGVCVYGMCCVYHIRTSTSHE